MSHLTLDKEALGQVSDEKLASLLERDLNDSFQLDKNESFSSICDTKRRVKPHKGPLYRKINTYFKSTKQYWKERNRRKKVLHLWMVEFRSQKEIADKLGVSVSTVKRDQKKLERFVRGQTNRAMRAMQDEWRQKRQQAMEGLSLRERFDYLSKEMELYRKNWRNTNYRGHYTIFYLDLTQTDKYGVPKLTLLPRQTANKPLAYPHAVRLRIKNSFEGRTYEAELGGFDITQTTGWR